MVEFYCPVDGKYFGTATPCVRLLLPDVCCGNSVKLHFQNNGGTPFNGVIHASLLGRWCPLHMQGDGKTISAMEVIWNNFGPNGAMMAGSGFMHFWCPRDGLYLNIKDCVLVQIPAVCCGHKTSFFNPSAMGLNNPNTLPVTNCRTHLLSWDQVWNNFGPNGTMLIGNNVATPAGPQGVQGTITRNGTIVIKGGTAQASSPGPGGLTIKDPQGFNISGKTKSSGMSCSSCKEFNEYAEPNQPDNITYKCYSCRSF